MTSEYTVTYSQSVVWEDIPKIPKSHKSEIKKAIEKKLMVNPVAFGKPLQYSLAGNRRLRVGDYRVVFRIDETKKIVIITKIGNRKDVYA